MILAALLLPVAVAVLLLCVHRFRLPVFLALMAVIVGYGIAAQMTYQSIGKAFGLGFTSALGQAGLLAVGSLVLLLRAWKHRGEGKVFLGQHAALPRSWSRWVMGESDDDRSP